MEETSIKLQGNFGQSIFGTAMKSAFEKALAIDHKLSSDIVNMPGMSGRKYRYFINWVVAHLPTPRYLEVGSWAGSTACSAIYENQIQLTCIDNWSEFNGPKDVFLSNVSRILTKNVDFKFIELDFRKVNFQSLGNFNIYLFDGPHEEVDQYDGIVMAQPALDDHYILIVDDFNWPSVRDGTQRAIQDLDLELECSIEIRTTQDNTHPTIAAHQNSDWHNGYFIASIRKKNTHF